MSAATAPATAASLYLVAQGGKATADKSGTENSAIVLMTVLGSKAPARVTINEFTTVASVWTHTQFLTGTAISGHALGLRIAAGNVPNFVDVETGGWGTAIQDAIQQHADADARKFRHSHQRHGRMRHAGDGECVRELFLAAAGPAGKQPVDTLTAAQSIARNPAYKPERIFALLDAFYPIPPAKKLRVTPFLPYLSFAPSAWVLPLKFGGGGLNGPGKIMFDSNGNAWTGDNFIVGFQFTGCLLEWQFVGNRAQRPTAFAHDDWLYGRWSRGSGIRHRGCCGWNGVGRQHLRQVDFSL